MTQIPKSLSAGQLVRSHWASSAVSQTLNAYFIHFNCVENPINTEECMPQVSANIFRFGGYLMPFRKILKR
jgi:hypothetical protein